MDSTSPKLPTPSPDDFRKPIRSREAAQNLLKHFPDHPHRLVATLIASGQLPPETDVPEEPPKE